MGLGLCWRVWGIVLAWGLENRVMGLVLWFYMFAIAMIALGWSYSVRKTENGVLNGDGTWVFSVVKKQEL